MTTPLEKMGERQDGDYKAPVTKEPKGGPIPQPTKGD